MTFSLNKNEKDFVASFKRVLTLAEQNNLEIIQNPEVLN
jgi:hypothetical protein